MQSLQRIQGLEKIECSGRGVNEVNEPVNVAVVAGGRVFPAGAGGVAVGNQFGGAVAVAAGVTVVEGVAAAAAAVDILVAAVGVFPAGVGDAAGGYHVVVVGGADDGRVAAAVADGVTAVEVVAAAVAAVDILGAGIVQGVEEDVVEKQEGMVAA